MGAARHPTRLRSEQGLAAREDRQPLLYPGRQVPTGPFDSQGDQGSSMYEWRLPIGTVPVRTFSG